MPTPTQETLSLSALQRLASKWQEEGDLQQCALVCRDIVQRCEADFGPHSSPLAQALVNFSAVLYRQKDLDGAEALLLQAQAIWKGQKPLPPELGTCLNNLARIEEERGRPAAGIALHRQAVALRREMLGACHSDTAFSMGNLGVALASDGQWHEAVETLEAAVACYAQLGKQDSPDAVGYRENLAVCRRALAAAGLSPPTAPATTSPASSSMGGTVPVALGEREAVLQEIIERELAMFLATPNEGGVASCQQRPGGFRIMRRMTYEPLSDATLLSWLDDLRRAKEQGRNVMIEKYARMDDRLPPLQNNPRIAEIVALETDFAREMAVSYPLVMQGPTGTESGFARYLRCELETLSPATLELYAADLHRAAHEGLNPVQARYECLARLLGKGNLDAMERGMRAG